MDTKLIIAVVSAAICIGCYLDIRRKRKVLEKALQRMGAVRPLYVEPTIFGVSPQMLVVVLAAVVAAICVVQL